MLYKIICSVFQCDVRMHVYNVALLVLVALATCVCLIE